MKANKSDITTMRREMDRQTDNSFESKQLKKRAHERTNDYQGVRTKIETFIHPLNHPITLFVHMLERNCWQKEMLRKGKEKYSMQIAKKNLFELPDSWQRETRWKRGGMWRDEMSR